jgi:hypothetical protein
MQAFRRSTLSSLRNVAAVQRRGYAAANTPYAETVKNLRINSDTKLLFQGFTGKQGTYGLPPFPFQFPFRLADVVFPCAGSMPSKRSLMVFQPSDVTRIAAWTSRSSQ